jgi:ribonuclease HIII
MVLYIRVIRKKIAFTKKVRKKFTRRGLMTAGLRGIYEIILKKLLRYDFVVSAPAEINYGIQFEIRKQEWRSMMRIYEKKNGKINIDYSALKGEKADAVKSIIEGKKTIAEESISVVYPYIGTDESGKGDTFGPLAIAGVLLNEPQQKILAAAGVKDSKENSDEINLRLADVIKENCGNSIEVMTIMPEQYNELYAAHKNVNTILAGAHSSIIKKLASNGNCSMAIIDQFADSSLISKNFGDDEIKLYHTTGGEKYTAVAAASILARKAFLDGLKTLSERFGIELPKGSSENAAFAIETIKKRNIADKMHLMAKTHFANVKAALNRGN